MGYEKRDKGLFVGILGFDREIRNYLHFIWIMGSPTRLTS